jgi:hypothetical protein
MRTAAAIVTEEAEPLPLPPPPRRPRFARGSIAPPFFDPEILGVRVIEPVPPSEWGPLERVPLSAKADRIALSIVVALGTAAALLATALIS